MPTRKLEGDFCNRGLGCFVNPILKGQWALEELLFENKCECSQKRHSWLCYQRFHKKAVRLHPEEIHTFVLGNRTKLLARPNIVSELQAICNMANESHMWIYSFYPLICDMPQFRLSIRDASTGIRSIDYVKHLMRYGMCGDFFSEDEQFNMDQRLYLSLYNSGQYEGAKIGNVRLGMYSSQLAKRVYQVCGKFNLPVEITIMIFNICYGCEISARNFEEAIDLKLSW